MHDKRSKRTLKSLAKSKRGTKITILPAVPSLLATRKIFSKDNESEMIGKRGTLLKITIIEESRNVLSWNGQYPDEQSGEKVRGFDVFSRFLILELARCIKSSYSG